MSKEREDFFRLTQTYPLYILQPGGEIKVVAARPWGGYDDVAAFHAKFGVPSHLDTPLGLPSKDVLEFRAKFLKEELTEMVEAYEAHDLQKYLDALLDLVYVAYGTALMSGVSPELWAKLWQTVQDANMRKVRAASVEESAAKTGRSSQYDVVKPDGWVSPDNAQKALIIEAGLHQAFKNIDP